MFIEPKKLIKKMQFFLKKGLQKYKKRVVYIVTYQTDLETTRDEEKRER